ncbi:MAG: tetratricopeptide repeat protein [Planctomycetes bacterium]|nr:tetratricopeptide repeat protein [Planctomycetota bacterium]
MSGESSIFSRSTVDDLRAATAEARCAGSAIAAELAHCEAVQRAVELIGHGDAAAGSEILRETMRQTREPRLLFLAFQYFFRSGDLDLAEEATRRRLSVVGEGSADAARAWTNLGLIYFFKKEYALAEEMHQRACEIDRANGDVRGLARDLGNWAMIPEARQEWARAEKMYLEALELAERAKARDVMATKLANLGQMYEVMGRREEAVGFTLRALELFKELGEAKYAAECESLLRKLKAES